MMSKKLIILYLIICIITFFLSFLFFAYQKEWIFIRFFIKQEEKLIEVKNYKKDIKLIYWNNNKWNYENVELIISENEAENILRIINNLLVLLNEENIIDKIILQSSMITKNGQDVYLSFNKNIFYNESSTHQKLMLLEGLLKTLRENNIKVSKVYFLVNHKEMKDPHLDFSNPWPIQGFVESRKN